MRGINRLGRWAVLCLAALAGCDAGPEERLQAACTVICRCFGDPLPSQQDECIGECVTEISFVSEACEQCITRNANRCSSLEFECGPLCDNPEPDPGSGGEPPPDGGF